MTEQTGLLFGTEDAALCWVVINTGTWPDTSAASRAGTRMP